MTVHLASEILRLMLQQVVIWVWNYGMLWVWVWFSFFFSFPLEQFKVKLSIFISLVVSKLHVLTLKTILTIHIHVNMYLLC